MSSSRITVASLIFVVCCLLSSVHLIVDAPAASGLKPGSDDIARRSDQRFSALKSTLPQRGVVGYIGEPGPLALGDYYLAQYALAPVVVDHSPNHDLVIGNFPNSLSGDLPFNLQLKKDFGSGVLLFATRPAPQRNSQ
jgi:hypothetical protein